ncbi:TetR/AcrR family transcriptional regulator [Frankia sp. CNm7]|uniref:TetR/AcrR family transcriptional regulator n=1 Tax=Frankia nepalensis TaxID=1836974 RepID=A0A937RBU1_9ACTN|nr:TetR/AcrR family transcriptional regulator [Frankia nepalensis]MBL7496956.1 TetR/AcrR family transcriptional regulator [Frankia nepalensis]MBL7511343.1 TetR/AcrR family transcriptional regulator [Frankia nepalensis]MBL7523900.1 TetR/AcrR family transcriptional regulator [Frankia nepalensis]MBL7626110.1 TetR/AcrR family transcriptional regulator [Frankia nepalensis]
MPTEPSAYHRRVAEQKRAAITEAATRLFLDSGYDGTSLAKIAEAAGVSKATLFKQFPTKAALFDAIVTESWKVEDESELHPPTGDLRQGLTTIGRRYVALLTRPGMAALFRIVIAELPRFPELGETHFSRGKMPYFDSVRRYLDAEHAAGTATLEDTELATTQFLGMISNHVFWPRMLLPRWAPDEASMARVVDEAVLTMTARYGTPTTAAG